MHAIENKTIKLSRFKGAMTSIHELLLDFGKVICGSGRKPHG